MTSNSHQKMFFFISQHTCTYVSIRSTPYCISQKNIVPLHGGIIFLNFETKKCNLASISTS